MCVSSAQEGGPAKVCSEGDKHKHSGTWTQTSRHSSEETLLTLFMSGIVRLHAASAPIVAGSHTCTCTLSHNLEYKQTKQRGHALADQGTPTGDVKGSSWRQQAGDAEASLLMRREIDVQSRRRCEAEGIASVSK